MAIDSKVMEDFILALKPDDTAANDTHSAIVSKIDGEGVAWVYVAGSSKETPTASSSTEVKRGDAVNVVWRNNKLYIAGNDTNPAAGIGRVQAIEESAIEAFNNAAIARASAESAKNDAEVARGAAAEAKATTDEINAYASSVSKTVTQVLADGETAGAAAQEAQQSAKEAKSAAESSVRSLSIVEDVVGTVNWITDHASFTQSTDEYVDPNKQYYAAVYDYVETEDTVIDPAKTYYTRTGDGTEEHPYVYTAVQNPDVSHISEYFEYIFVDYEPVNLTEEDDPTDYYEIEIQQAITNFILSHLAMTDRGLWVILDNSDYQLLVASDGVYTYGPNGIMTKAGANIEFADDMPQHIGGKDSYVEFDPANNRLNIVADNIMIGNKDALERIETFESVVPQIQEQITAQSQENQRQNGTLDLLTGYVDIRPSESTILVGERTSTSHVKISGASNNLGVSISLDGQKDVAYMKQDRLYAPSAVVSNLYMQTELGGGNPIGGLGFVMRSNGHLSLKSIR